MFRESDFKDRKIHPSFTNKPVPSFQLQCQSSKLEVTEAPVVTPREVVPTTWDCYHDPSHPLADWAGMVQRDLAFNQRKHRSDHVSQQVCLEHTDKGIISMEDVHHYRKGKNPAAAQLENTRSLIGGIETNNRYETTYHRQANRIETDRSQLVLNKREMPRKIIPDPAQSKSNSNNSSRRNSVNESYAESGSENIYGDNADQFIYEQETPRDYSSIPMNKSLLSNLGSSLVGAISLPEKARVPKDNNPNKINLTQNYNTRPGYTGRRPEQS